VNFADAVEKPNPTPEASETNSVQEGGTSENVADVMYGLHHDVLFRR